MGAEASMQPDLFGAVLAGVSFMYVMNMMSNASIPLTTGKWKEWRNPHAEEVEGAQGS